MSVICQPARNRHGYTRAMALRQKLVKPFVVEPTLDHTHSVVFLHRFPEATSDDELSDKVLSSKQTRNHRTLHEQFPTVRWVFPFAKTGARPYGNLTIDDKAAVGLATTRTPYITQILLQEAKRAGGLDKVVLGGQGETAVAGHEAMASFPEISAALRSRPGEVEGFLRDTFHAPSWTDATTCPRLAGFVGMHAEAREVTRDIASYGIASKAPNDPPRVNTSIVVNTPHCFIHGGYKVQTTTWDGRRIDDFAKFLALDLGVYRVPDPEVQLGKNETLTPKDRREQKPFEEREALNEVQKRALKLAKEKMENKAMVDKIKQRIEADKVERKIRKERERQARLRTQRLEAEAAQGPETEAAQRPEAKARTKHSYSSKGGFGTMDTQARESSEGSEDSDGDYSGSEWSKSHSKEKSKKQPPGRRAAGEMDWEAPSGVKGEMSEARMRAFGLIPGNKTAAEEEKDA